MDQFVIPCKACLRTCKFTISIVVDFCKAQCPVPYTHLIHVAIKAECRYCTTSKSARGAGYRVATLYGAARQHPIQVSVESSADDVPYQGTMMPNARLRKWHPKLRASTSSTEIYFTVIPGIDKKVFATQ